MPTTDDIQALDASGATLPAGDGVPNPNTAAVAQQPVPPGGVQAQRRFQLPSFCHNPLSREATIAFLKEAANVSVMGLVTLSMFCATYLLAWGPPGSGCIPAKPEKPEVFKPSWVQVLYATLPFVLYPVTLFVNGLVPAAEKDGHALGFVSTLCLVECIAAIALGGGIIICMSGSVWVLWLVIGLVLVILIVVTWPHEASPSSIRSSD